MASSDGPSSLWECGTWLARAAWLLRRLRLSRLVWQVRQTAIHGILKRFHFNVLHRMQRLAVDAPDRKAELESASTLALQICTEYRELMGIFLEVPANKLHCCFKLMAPQIAENQGDRVATWVRSEPFDNRPMEDTIEQAHAVSCNSVWSAILGEYDGKTDWSRFRCFSCNDLTAHPEAFRCDRENWNQYYRSTLVVPIRHPSNRLGTEHIHLGFVAFDSPDKKVFRGLPDILEYRDDPTGYSEQVEASAAFHLAGILADTLGSFLGPTMNGRSPGHDEENDSANKKD